MAVDTDFQARDHLNAVAEGRDFTVDADAPGCNDRFDFTAGAVARAGQPFL